jgi:hypothetical protein
MLLWRRQGRTLRAYSMKMIVFLSFLDLRHAKNIQSGRTRPLAMAAVLYRFGNLQDHPVEIRIWQESQIVKKLLKREKVLE